jgi:hypothetical protein
MRDNTPPPVHADVRYEKSDAWIGGVIAFGVMLAALGLIVHVSASWLFDSLKASEQRKYQQVPALYLKERPQLPGDLERIPPPRLQKNETVDLKKLREYEEPLLDQFGWVDRDKGIVRIPIEEAMRLLADPQTASDKGIRVRPLKEDKK